MILWVSQIRNVFIFETWTQYRFSRCGKQFGVASLVCLPHPLCTPLLLPPLEHVTTACVHSMFVSDSIFYISKGFILFVMKFQRDLFCSWWTIQNAIAKTHTRFADSWLFGSVISLLPLINVFWSVGWSVGQSVIISEKGGKLHFHAPFIPPTMCYGKRILILNY